MTSSGVVVHARIQAMPCLRLQIRLWLSRLLAQPLSLGFNPLVIVWV
jgi:hypothetical protein